MNAGSEEVGDLRCPERGFSAPSNQTAPSDQAAGAPGGAFRALPANGGGSVAVANAAGAADTVALVEHGMCGGFSWLCTAAGQASRNALVRHGAKAGFAGAAWRWLLFGTDADRPPGQISMDGGVEVEDKVGVLVLLRPVPAPALVRVLEELEPRRRRLRSRRGRVCDSLR